MRRLIASPKKRILKDAMTNEDLLADLKQFISATVSQQLADVATKEDIGKITERLDGMDRRFDAMEKRFDDTDLQLDAVQQAIGEAVERIESASRVDRAKLDDLDQRFRRFEQRSA